MFDSILLSVREQLVGDSEDESFDNDLIFDINVALNTLTQVGIGPEEGFRVTGEDETWSDFIGTDPLLESVKEYVTLRTRVLFDPPASSFVLEEMKKELDEMLWRLNVTVDDQTGGNTNG